MPSASRTATPHALFHDPKLMTTRATTHDRGPFGVTPHSLSLSLARARPHTLLFGASIAKGVALAAILHVEERRMMGRTKCR